MTRRDAKALVHFMARMGMYICPCDKHGIVSFIHGWEAGRGRSEFTQMLSQELAGKHRIRHDSLGWSGQVGRYGERHGIDWVAAFRLVASALLARTLDSKGKATAVQNEKRKKKNAA